MFDFPRPLSYYGLNDGILCEQVQAVQAEKAEKAEVKAG
jgi:hypothetical protein